MDPPAKLVTVTCCESSSASLDGFSRTLHHCERCNTTQAGCRYTRLLYWRYLWRHSENTLMAHHWRWKFHTPHRECCIGSQRPRVVCFTVSLKIWLWWCFPQKTKPRGKPTLHKFIARHAKVRMYAQVGLDREQGFFVIGSETPVYRDQRRSHLLKDKARCGCFLKWWYPQNTPKWSFLVGKPMVIGETHHFRKPPYIPKWETKWTGNGAASCIGTCFVGIFVGSFWIFSHPDPSPARPRWQIRWHELGKGYSITNLKSQRSFAAKRIHCAIEFAWCCTSWHASPKSTSFNRNLM